MEFGVESSLGPGFYLSRGENRGGVPRLAWRKAWDLGAPFWTETALRQGEGAGTLRSARSGPDPAPLCSRRELAPVRRELRAPHHAAAPLPARAALLERAGQVRRLQRARQRAERHALSAKVMQRQNRARESHPRRPKHQGNFIYQPCQRQFNY